MASRHVLALEQAGTMEQTDRALQTIVQETDTELDTIVGIQYRNDVVHAGGLKTIVKVMKEYHDVVRIQDWACQALSNLAFENDKMRVVIAQLGGISSILHAMTVHDDDESLQWHALQALWRLTFNDWVRDKMVTMGSIDKIRHAMAKHPESHEYVQFWSELTLKHLEEHLDDDDDSKDIPEWLIDFCVAILLLLFFRSLY